jgi:photosystem II stability/assembly factor-like uncharacterized protein
LAWLAVAGGGCGAAPDTAPVLTLAPCSAGVVEPARTGPLVFSRDGNVIYVLGERVEAARLKRELLRSVDGGQTFCRLATPIPFLSIAAGSATIWGRSLDSLHLSSDLGKTWTPVWDPSMGTPVRIVEPLPGSDDVLWVEGTEHGQSALAVTRDRGRSWTSVAPPLSTATGAVEVRTVLGVDPTRPGHALFSILTVNSSTLSGREDVLRTDDFGTTFKLLSTTGGYLRVSDRHVADGAGALYTTAPEGLVRSLDGGTSWQRMGATPPGEDLFSPGGAGHLVTTRGSELFESLDAGASFRFVPLPVGAALVGVSAHPGHFFVSSGRGFESTTDGGATWRLLFTSAAAAHGLTEDAGGAIWASAPGALLRSADGGKSFTATEAPWEQPYHLLAVPQGLLEIDLAGVRLADPEGNGWHVVLPLEAHGPPTGVSVRGARVAISAVERVACSSDGGLTWRQVALGNPPAGLSRAVALDPLDPNRVIAIALGSGDLEVHESTDGCATFVRRSLLPALDPDAILVMTFLPDGKTVLAAGQQGILRSDDRGLTFRPANQGIVPLVPRAVDGVPLHGLTLGPTGSDWVVAYGGGADVFLSRDGGGSWNRQVLPGFTQSDVGLSSARILQVVALQRAPMHLLVAAPFDRSKLFSPEYLPAQAPFGFFEWILP